MNTERATSRRAVLSGVVVSLASAAAVNAAALSASREAHDVVPVVYVGEPDPVFALIARHKEAFDRWNEAIAAANTPELHEEQKRLNFVEAGALHDVLSCEPTTIAGVLTQLAFCNTFYETFEYELFEDEHAAPLLVKSLAASLRRIGGVA